MPPTEGFFRWRPHPWHGLDVGPEPPGLVHAYIELTPFDLVKYEIDKATGYLRVDRPQRTSSLPPTLYGFIPRTWCGPRVGRLSPGAVRGDGDPMDICVVSERPIGRAEVILTARVLGGLQVLDGGDADDKVVAVLANDDLWAGARDIGDLPGPLVERLGHYFRTYKLVGPAGGPGGAEPARDTGRARGAGGRDAPQIVLRRVYGRDHALDVIRAAMEDYAERYGAIGAGA